MEEDVREERSSVFLPSYETAWLMLLWPFAGTRAQAHVPKGFVAVGAGLTSGSSFLHDPEIHGLSFLWTGKRLPESEE